MHFERFAELGIWLILILILFGVQLFPIQVIAKETAYMLAGGIISFALFYYYVAWKIFKPSERRFLKDLADLIFIGVILLVAREYGAYFFTLLFIPIAAAALTLDLLHSLLIAMVAAVLAALEITLSGQGYLNQSTILLSGGQFLIFLLATLVARLLALQIRHERETVILAKAKAARLSAALTEERHLQAMEREFINLASHQLLTPISIIRGFASLLLEPPNKLTQTQKHGLSEIYENSRRMVQLIEDLRLMSRIVEHRYPIKPRHQSLNPFLADLCDEFRARAKTARLRFTATLPKQSIKADFDPDATRQIIWNLLDNALRYTPAGRKINLELSRLADTALIKISDTGIGIPKVEQPKIFDRFYRASNAMERYHDGTGLGLSIARELAYRERGDLTFTSELNQGSTFTLELPT